MKLKMVEKEQRILVKREILYVSCYESYLKQQEDLAQLSAFSIAYFFLLCCLALAFADPLKGRKFGMFELIKKKINLLEM